MGLEAPDRGSLEKTIDRTIKKIPDLVRKFRNQELRKRFQITNSEEFTYGFVHAEILTQFSAYIVIMHDREPTDDEYEEIASILEKRSREIKEAIFNCG